MAATNKNINLKTSTFPSLTIFSLSLSFSFLFFSFGYTTLGFDTHIFFFLRWKRIFHFNFNFFWILFPPSNLSAFCVKFVRGKKKWRIRKTFCLGLLEEGFREKLLLLIVFGKITLWVKKFFFFLEYPKLTSHLNFSVIYTK